MDRAGFMAEASVYATQNRYLTVMAWTGYERPHRLDAATFRAVTAWHASAYATVEG